jgi:hypothetical protein
MATFSERPRTLSRHRPRRRAIQYSKAASDETEKPRGVLDTPLSRGMTAQSKWAVHPNS